MDSCWKSGQTRLKNTILSCGHFETFLSILRAPLPPDKMSTVQKNQTAWPNISEKSLDSKHEKCRNIAEEIYKRINITFQIKKLEAGQSDISDHNSDQIDSNELSNETDLFACDKSDSISSSTEAEKPQATCEKYININNNEETNLKKATVAVYKRPKKRFRKRVKKRTQTQRNRSDSDGSSDEALPLSRIVDIDTKCVKSELCTAESLDNVMGVPNIVILARDLKPKPKTPEKKSTKKDNLNVKQKPLIQMPNILNKTPTVVLEKNIEMDRAAMLDLSMKSDEKGGNLEWKNCTLCSLSFRGERGLRRHMTISHIISPEDTK